MGDKVIITEKDILNMNRQYDNQFDSELKQKALDEYEEEQNYKLYSTCRESNKTPMIIRKKQRRVKNKLAKKSKQKNRRNN